MQKDERLLSVGVVGAGPIAQFAHLEACRRARNVQLYAICDVAPDLLDRMAAIHQPRATYTDYERMLTDPHVDAVIIATADAFHIALATAAVRAHKHVFVEKPLGLSVDEALQLRDEPRPSELAFQIGFNRRFDPAVSFARDFVEREIGTMSLFHAWYCDSTSRYTMTDNLQAIPFTSTQKRKPAQDPKADKSKYFLLTHGSHLFDTARFIAGPIQAIEARLREQSGAYHWSISLQFQSGCLGTMAIIIPARADFQEGIHVFGSGGSIQGRLHLPWYRKAGDIECYSDNDRTFRRPLGADADTYKLQLESFASVILDKAPQRGATLDDGVENMRALIATARSSESGKWRELATAEGSV